MSTTSDPWQPYRSDGKGKQPVPESASYGLFIACVALLLYIQRKYKQ